LRRLRIRLNVLMEEAGWLGGSKTMSRMILGAAMLFAIIVSCPSDAAYAQDPQCALAPSPKHSPNPFVAAGNSWQLLAGDEEPKNDLVAPDVRAARNAYWAKAMQMYKTAPGTGVVVGGGSYFADAPEIDPALGTIFAVVQFQSFEVFDASKGEYLPYTEMYFKIERVVASPSTQAFSEGELLSMDIPGGRLRTPTGEIRTIGVYPMSHYFQVGNTYLVQLRPSVAGTFSASKRWKVANGILVPDTDQEISRSKKGGSALQGRSVDDASAFIRQAVGDQHAH